MKRYATAVNMTRGGSLRYQKILWIIDMCVPMELRHLTLLFPRPSRLVVAFHQSLDTSKCEQRRNASLEKIAFLRHIHKLLTLILASRSAPAALHVKICDWKIVWCHTGSWQWLINNQFLSRWLCVAAFRCMRWLLGETDWSLCTGTFD